jgi:hypothetical protein
LATLISLDAEPEIITDQFGYLENKLDIQHFRVIMVGDLKNHRLV